MFKRSIKLQRLLNTLYLFAYKNTTLTSDVAALLIRSWTPLFKNLNNDGVGCNNLPR